MGMHAQFFPPEHYQQFRERFAAGHGMYPIIGDPDHVADELERIVADRHGRHRVRHVQLPRRDALLRPGGPAAPRGQGAQAGCGTSIPNSGMTSVANSSS